MLMTLLSRVDIRADRLEISLRRLRLVELLGSGSIDLMTQRGTPDNEGMPVLTLTVKARLQRVGREMKMLVENTDDSRGGNRTLDRKWAEMRGDKAVRRKAALTMAGGKYQSN